MAAAAEAEFDEVISIVNELEVLLNACTEQDSINTIIEYKTKLKQLREKQNEQIKTTITEILDEKNQNEEKCEERISAEIEQIKQNMELLEKCKKEVTEQQETVSTDVNRFTKQINKTRMDSEQLENLKTTAKHKTEIELPTLRNLIKLYQSVTDIKWQFETEPDEIKGTVLNSKAIKPFKLNKNERSSFYIANYLWQQIDADWN
ncbi:kinetochore protein spc24-like [Tubulanus polymorphus]|uniref:kinetochore protein spc24-like n=1 Tax=Tubulanus polymorphus TaxID=672921 RepID=UPI003DA3E15B